MADSQPSGWFYRLSPRLVLRTRVPERLETGERVLLVQSGEAFPPGHPSTRLCLDLLREALAAAPVQRLLDVGCGAGVLSLAAAALEVPRVVAVDLAFAAARATRENARGNDLAGSILTVRGSTEGLRVPFDLVLANLPWEVHMAKVAELDRLAPPEAGLILAGFRDNQEGLLLKGYQGLGWSLQQRLVKHFYHPELPPEISFNWVAWRLGR